MPGNDRNDNSIKRLKTSPLARNMAMARIGLVAGSQIATHEALNLFRGKKAREVSNRSFYTRQAEYLRDELGQLKGSIMKLGQMLSLYGQYFMPPEAVSVLASLQDDTPPVSWSAVRPQIEDSLGPRRMAELEIEPRPLASASLGQVHIAYRERDRRKLVLKVQYPGVGDAIDSDIRSLSRVMQLTQVVPKGISLGPIMEEVREMLHQEVDYGRELRMTGWYHRQLKDDSRYVVPETIEDYCTDDILATSFEEASHVHSPEVQGLSQARRNRIALAALELFFNEFLRWDRVQTDPHFGNFKVRVDPHGENDRLVLIDFGATRDFSRPFLNAYRDIIAGAVNDDRDVILRGAETIGLMRAQFGDSVRDSFAEVCRLIIEPFAEVTAERPPRQWLTKEGAYKWGETDLPKRVSAAVAKAALSRYFRVPPREIVFLHRRLAGVFILVASLRAELVARPLLLRFL
ncbi:MAG: ABC1 kinase family protein [Nevskiales bacterium]